MRVPREEGRDELGELRGAPGFLATGEWGGARPGERYFVGVRRDGFSLRGPDGRAAHFDAEGRLRRAAFLDPELDVVQYLRGLDGRLLRKEREGGKRRAPRDADPAGGDPLARGGSLADPTGRRRVYEAVHELVRSALAGGLASGGGKATGPREPARATDAGRAPAPPDDRLAIEHLERAARWGAGRLEAERERFLEAYHPLGIIPPDRYRSLILQATFGCSWNGCVFCSLYRGQRFRPRPPEEFRDHVRRVVAFFGRAIEARRGVFLSEANALMIDQEPLLEILRVAREELPESVLALASPRAGGGGEGRAERGGARAGAAGRDASAAWSPGGFSSFVDSFSRGDKTAREFAALGQLGLRRVFLGVESGEREVLRFLRKPASPERVREIVGELKEAGISVGAIIMAGVGGRKLEPAHRDQSVELLGSLPLDSSDVIYVSPLVAEPGGRYDLAEREAGLGRLSREEIRAQVHHFLRALRPRRGASGPRVSLYDMRAFVYA